MTDLSELRFFQTTSHACGYLEERQSRNLVVDPLLDLDGNIYSFLSGYGFRRSGNQIYRPNCENCNSCVPIRVLVNSFHPSKSQRRCLNKNRDLKSFKVSTIDTDELYDLYERYINERHSDGEMYPPTREQYRDFLSTAWGITEYIVLRDANNNALSVAVTDVFHNGLSAMYSFFDPSQTDRSLGTFNILYQILWARERNLPFLYMGYWISESQKMSYKTQYRPFELLKNNQWVGE